MLSPLPPQVFVAFVDNRKVHPRARESRKSLFFGTIDTSASEQRSRANQAASNSPQSKATTSNTHYNTNAIRHSMIVTMMTSVHSFGRSSISSNHRRQASARVDLHVHSRSCGIRRSPLLLLNMHHHCPIVA